MSSILRNKTTGLYLAGWDVLGNPKFVSDVKLADNMNFPTANRVKDNLKQKFNAGDFEVVPQK